MSTPYSPFTPIHREPAKRVFTVEFSTYDEQEAEKAYGLLELFMETNGFSGLLSQSSDDDDADDPLMCPTLVIAGETEDK